MSLINQSIRNALLVLGCFFVAGAYAQNPITIEYQGDAAAGITKLLLDNEELVGPAFKNAVCILKAVRPSRIDEMKWNDSTNSLDCRFVTDHPRKDSTWSLRMNLSDSMTTAWGGVGETHSMLLTGGTQLPKVFDRMKFVALLEFNGKTDGSIYFPIVACSINEETREVASCTEAYYIMRNLQGEGRASMFCSQNTDAVGDLEKANIHPHEYSFGARKAMAEQIASQLKAGKRVVTKTSCGFLD